MALKECECGCGTLIEEYDKRGIPRRFVHAHNFRGKNHPWLGKQRSKETRLKISKTKKGVKLTEEARKNVIKALTGRVQSAEKRRKCSEANKGENHPMYGKKQSEEHILKRSKALTGKKRSKEYCIKMSQRQIGDKNHAWKGGLSFRKYCPKFNNDLKERVREFFGRQCFICTKSEMDNGVKLAVHHVNFDKMVCCNDVEPLFVPLCMSCHSKTQHDRDYWQNRLEEELMKRTGGKCYYTPDEFKNL